MSDPHRISLSFRTVVRGTLGLFLGAVVLLVLARAIVWSSADEITTGITAPPQVYIWDLDLEDFGGYSALVVTADGENFTAGSDRSHYLTGRFQRNGAGRITSTHDVTRWPVRYGIPDTMTPFKGDLEALSPLPDGRIAMAFEGYARIEVLPRPGAVPTGLHRWDLFEDRFGNTAFEALATLPDETLLGVLERTGSKTLTQAYRYTDNTFEGPQPFPVTRGFSVTGADVGPDGCLYVLERRYGVFTGFQFQLIRMSPYPPWATQTRALLYRSAPMQMGNGEGLSIWRHNNSLIATVITDDGYVPLTPTRLIELTLAPAPDCADQ